MCSELLFDLHLYSSMDSSDLNNKALCIYKRILESHKEMPPLAEFTQSQSKAGKATPTIEQLSDQSKAQIDQSEDHDTGLMSASATFSGSSLSAMSLSEGNYARSERLVAQPSMSQQLVLANRSAVKFPSLQPPECPSNDNDAIYDEICRCFDQLNNLLYSKSLRNYAT